MHRIFKTALALLVLLALTGCEFFLGQQSGGGADALPPPPTPPVNISNRHRIVLSTFNTFAVHGDLIQDGRRFYDWPADTRVLWDAEVTFAGYYRVSLRYASDRPSAGYVTVFGYSFAFDLPATDDPAEFQDRILATLFLEYGDEGYIILAPGENADRFVAFEALVFEWIR